LVDLLKNLAHHWWKKKESDSMMFKEARKGLPNLNLLVISEAKSIEDGRTTANI